jgi:quercetin dioxygenase-like cupin family protein
VYAYVLAGTLEVALENGQVLTYKSGDAIIEVVDTLHNGRYREADPVRLVVFYVGIQGSPNVVKPVSPNPGSDPQAE